MQILSDVLSAEHLVVALPGAKEGDKGDSLQESLARLARFQQDVVGRPTWWISGEDTTEHSQGNTTLCRTCEGSVKKNSSESHYDSALVI